MDDLLYWYNIQSRTELNVNFSTIYQPPIDTYLVSYVVIIGNFSVRNHCKGNKNRL